MTDSFDIDEINRQALLGSDTESDYIENVYNNINQNDMHPPIFQNIEPEVELSIEKTTKKEISNTNGDKLWANKNYQFETKSPSFYDSIPKIESQAIAKINYAINSSEKCAKCNENVYSREEIKYSNKKFHRSCFRCHNCNNTLQMNRLTEHGKYLYCQNCYEKKFGNKKYANTDKSSEVTERIDVIEEDMFDTQSESNFRRKTISNFEPSVNIAETYALKNRRKLTIAGENSPNEYRSIKSMLKPLKNDATNIKSNSKVDMKQSQPGPAWSKDMLKPFKIVKRETEKCVKCAKPVYKIEEVKANDKIYHKICLKCYECNKTLDGTKVIEHAKATYCQKCYTKIMTKNYKVSEIECEQTYELPTKNFDQ